jgi:DNA-binding response OmpR family regulator
MHTKTPEPSNTVVVTVRVHAASPDVAARLVAQIHALAQQAERGARPANGPGRPAVAAAPDVVGAAPPSAVGPGPRLTVYPDRALVLLDGEPVPLTRLELALLTFLLDHPQRVFSRADLLTRVWGGHVGRNRRTVDVHVRRLRSKLGELAGVIHTVRGTGYRLDPADAVRLVHDLDPADTA